jgi:hypothetical protein
MLPADVPDQIANPRRHLTSRRRPSIFRDPHQMEVRTAEAAVIDGIGCCEDLSPRGLLIEAVRCVVRRGTITANAPYEVGCFPPELQALFMLLPLSRHCFVLQILVGLSPVVCAQLLDISTPDFEGALHAAALVQIQSCAIPRSGSAGSIETPGGMSVVSRRCRLPTLALSKRACRGGHNRGAGRGRQLTRGVNLRKARKPEETAGS